jgi:hypothetical protein
VWGSCLGFQTVSALASENPAIVTCGFDSESLSLALNFTPAAHTSQLYSQMPADIVASLAVDAFTLNYHSCGVTPAAAASSAAFQRRYHVLSTNMDRQGREFVSSIEAKDMPIFATQFHPELQMDGTTFCGSACHSDAAMSGAQEFANIFLRAARRSSHRLPREAFDAVALYQHHPYAMSSYGYYYIGRSQQQQQQQRQQQQPRDAAAHTAAAKKQGDHRLSSTGNWSSVAALGPIIGVLSVPDPPCVTFFAQMQQRHSHVPSRPRHGAVCVRT